MKKIYVIVSHSSGEIDTLLPLFFELKNKYKLKIKILVSVKKIYNQIVKNEFYLNTIKLLDISLCFSQSYNKFDYPITQNKKSFLIKLLIVLKYFFSNIDIFYYDYFFHETTDQKGSTIIFKIASYFFRKKIYIYHHGHSLNQVAIQKKHNYNKNNIYLAFSSLNLNWVKKLGFEKIKVIGFCKFYPNWQYYVKNYSNNFVKDKKYILIFSRPYDHPYYMNYKKYKYLLETSYKVIKEVLPDYNILIKLHPREEEIKVKNLIKDLDLKNVFITNEHSSVISAKAKLTISFWSSAILDSLSLNIPSIEYFIEDKLFKEAEPEGSLYRKNGIISVNNEDQLRYNIELIINDEYTQPQIVNYFKSEMNLDFFDQ